MKKQRNTIIDLAKYIASIFVVGIHTNPLSKINVSVNFVFIHIIFRLAVPFFLLCTGYFIGDKLVVGGGLSAIKCNKNLIIRREKKLVTLYGIWTIIYLLYSVPNWIQTGWFSPKAFIDYGIGMVTIGSHYHLWYLLDLICALPIVLFLLPFLNRRKLIVYSIVLYLIYAIQYGYRFILPIEISGLLASMFDALPVGTAAFLMASLIFLGIYIFRESKNHNQNIYCFGFIVSFILLSLEALLLRNMGQEKFSYIIFTYPTAYFLFCLLINMRPAIQPIKLFELLGSASTFIYCFHPIVIELINNRIKDPMIIFLFVTIISTILGVIFENAKCWFKKYRK